MLNALIYTKVKASIRADIIEFVECGSGSPSADGSGAISGVSILCLSAALAARISRGQGRRRGAGDRG